MNTNLLDANGYTLKNLGKINVILGKNGCGKSTLLKEVEKFLFSKQTYGKIKYITPERGGRLTYDPGVDNNIARDTEWVTNSRRVNRLENFRQQSVAQFRNLELLFLRELDGSPVLRANSDHTFKSYFNRLNCLLDNIEIRSDQSTFRIYKKGTDEIIQADAISSGESELISLGIECLVFSKECSLEKTNIIFFDEPDVHLHPDLQARLSHFLREFVSDNNVIIIVATHSTAILGAFENYEDTYIEFMSSNQKELNFKKISDEYRKIIPVFGAHPLSNLFNQAPIFLIEGEDDERIWQQTIRSSNRKLKIYPCSTDGEANMTQYEQDVDQIIKSVYDDAKAFSLRDRDEGTEEIDDLGVVKRFRLSCRASENLLLSNEVLTCLEIKWGDLEKKIDRWVEQNSSHVHYAAMLAFKNSGYDRKNYDLKEIRNDLMHIIGKPVAWEIAIGKTLGKLISEDKNNNTDEHSIFNYLGKKLISALLK